MFAHIAFASAFYVERTVATTKKRICPAVFRLFHPKPKHNTLELKQSRLFIPFFAEGHTEGSSGTPYSLSFHIFFVNLIF